MYAATGGSEPVPVTGAASHLIAEQPFTLSASGRTLSRV